MVLGNFLCRGSYHLYYSREGSTTVLAIGAGGVVWIFLTVIIFSPSFLQTVRNSQK